MGIIVSIAVYKSWSSEIRVCGYTVVPEFADFSDSNLFRDVKLPLEVAKDEELGENTNGLHSSFLANAKKGRGSGSLRQRLSPMEDHLQSYGRRTGRGGPVKRTCEILNHATLCNDNSDEFVSGSFQMVLVS